MNDSKNQHDELKLVHVQDGLLCVKIKDLQSVIELNDQNRQMMIDILKKHAETMNLVDGARYVPGVNHKKTAVASMRRLFNNLKKSEKESKLYLKNYMALLLNDSMEDLAKCSYTTKEGGEFDSDAFRRCFVFYKKPARSLDKEKRRRYNCSLSRSVVLIFGCVVTQFRKVKAEAMDTSQKTVLDHQSVTSILAFFENCPIVLAGIAFNLYILFIAASVYFIECAFKKCYQDSLFLQRLNSLFESALERVRKVIEKRDDLAWMLLIGMLLFSLYEFTVMHRNAVLCFMLFGDYCWLLLLIEACLVSLTLLLYFNLMVQRFLSAK